MGRFKNKSPSRGGTSLCVYIMLSAVLIGGYGALGLSLKGAKVAYDKLWDRLKAQEADNHRMEQSVAEMKVEAVTSETKAEELEATKEMLERNLEDGRRRMGEVERSNNELTKQLSEVQTSLEAAQRERGDARVRVDELQAKLDALQKKMTAVTAELEAARERVREAGAAGAVGKVGQQEQQQQQQVTGAAWDSRRGVGDLLVQTQLQQGSRIKA